MVINSYFVNIPIRKIGIGPKKINLHLKAVADVCDIYYFCRKIITIMAQAQDRSKKYWLLFLISLVLTIIWLIFFNAWFWIWLPALLTSLVLAMDKM